MNSFQIAVASVALVGACAVATAGDEKGHADHMKMMDANSDGMISRDEYMKHHEMKWSKMKKNASGMVDAKDLHGMRDNKMKSDDMMKDKK